MHGVVLLWKGNVFGLDFLESANRYGSLIAFAYLQPSLITVPAIPRHFAGYGQGLPYDSARLLGLDDVLNAHSDISTILYRICKHKFGTVSGEGDIRIRLEFYDALQAWQAALPPKKSFQHTQVQQYHYLRYVTCSSEQNLAPD